MAGDRLSGWVEIYSSPVGSSKAGSSGLIAHLRTLFAAFGVPLTMSSDGGPEFTATATEDFLARWGVHHRQSAAYNPQSNGRAEVAVKKAKRLLKSCIDPRGSLNNDHFLRGILQLRNTPDPECKLSPAEVLFGHPLRDAFSFINRCPKFENRAIRSIWHDAWASKEDALRTRYAGSMEKLNSHARQLPDLQAGERVFIQNQNGPHPNKWDRSGVVLESLGHNQYNIKVDGTGRITKRNRRFLRHYTLPGQPAIAPTADNPYHVPAASHVVPEAKIPMEQHQQSHSTTPATSSASPPLIGMQPMPLASQPVELKKRPCGLQSVRFQDKHDPGHAAAEHTRQDAAQDHDWHCPAHAAADYTQQQSETAIGAVPGAQAVPAPVPMNVTSPPRSTSAKETPSSVSARPIRDRRPTKRYDAATGKWI